MDLGARLKRRECGQSLVELAVVLPILTILVLGIIDFGMSMRAYVTVAQATREGARFATAGNAAGTFTTGGAGDCNGSTETSVVGRVCSGVDGLNTAKIENVAVTYPNGKTSGQSVRVKTTYRYEYVTPVDRVVSFFSGGVFSDHITITATTDMRLD